MTIRGRERHPSRRAALVMALGAMGHVACPAHAASISGATASSSLAAIARSHGLIFGASAGDELFKDAPYRDLFFEQAAMLTPDTAMKIDSLQPQQGRFDFAPADALIDDARKHGLLVRGHTLFWNDWLPAWLKALSKPEVERTFEVYLDTVVPHFAGRLHSWDVVNEPFHLGKDRPGTFRVGAWYDALGDAYIFRAFQRAADLDRTAKLVLNEAWTDRSDPVGLAVRRALLRLIDRMQDKGLRLDAIGLQGHLTPEIAYDDAGFVDFLHEIAARKLDIYITEFDVNDIKFPADVKADDAGVAARAGAFLRAVLAVPAVKMVVTWGLADRYTWWRDPDVMTDYGFTKLPRPLPYDDMLVKKPMWAAMAEAFQSRA